MQRYYKPSIENQVYLNFMPRCNVSSTKIVRNRDFPNIFILIVCVSIVYNAFKKVLDNKTEM